MRQRKPRPFPPRRDGGGPRDRPQEEARKEPPAGRFKGPAGERFKRPPRKEHGDRRARRGGDEAPVVIYGWHAVKAALDNPRRKILRLMATENAARRLGEDGAPARVTPEIVRPEAIARLLTADAVHNGLWLEAEPLDAPAVEALAPEGVVLVLDQITDPHNVGAILRSAAAFGVKALVTTARHSPEATGVLAKAASGALEHVPMVTVQNLARGLTALKERGFLTVGLDSAGASDLAALPLSSPLALVLGAEGKGLRQLTRETCDHVARLDLPGEIKSLNVSNAAALSLYIATTRLRC
jgi:23S rRNA (guanosine2251-2'-O)-methyltransferase